MKPKLLLNASILPDLRVFTNFYAKSLRINILNGWYFGSSTAKSNLHVLYFAWYLFVTTGKLECPVPVFMSLI